MPSLVTQPLEYRLTRPVMKSSQEHIDVARALSAAFEPLIDVCLTIGITSPEIESLLRATFVQRAFVKLPRHAAPAAAPAIPKSAWPQAFIAVK